jgi:hypothetical protein
MTIAQILVTGYLGIGALAFGLIWAALVASKRRENKAQNLNYGRLEYKLFGESNTKPSRFHT